LLHVATIGSQINQEKEKQDQSSEENTCDDQSLDHAPSRANLMVCPDVLARLQSGSLSPVVIVRWSIEAPPATTAAIGAHPPPGLDNINPFGPA
jgi:hypothetical protein